MTSDGITKKDWTKIHGLAVRIVNASAVEDQVRTTVYTKRLLDALDILEKKYGSLPSILATRADYILDNRDRLRLLQAAFNKALELNDVKNQLCTASSLAEYFIARRRIKSASKWLKVGQNLLKKYFDKNESQNLRDIAKQIALQSKTTATAK
jgi:hypothetical protein